MIPRSWLKPCSLFRFAAKKNWKIRLKNDEPKISRLVSIHNHSRKMPSKFERNQTVGSWCFDEALEDDETY